MTKDQFRRMALAMEGAIEGAHLGHPDSGMRPPKPRASKAASAPGRTAGARRGEET